MKVLKEARECMSGDMQKYITLLNASMESGDHIHAVVFDIQDGTIKENGINGLQVTDIVKYCLNLYELLNDNCPCDENERTIDALKLAIAWQDHRTVNRQRRGVEGFNVV